MSLTIVGTCGFVFLCCSCLWGMIQGILMVVLHDVPWLAASISLFVSGLFSAAILGVGISSIMVLYLSCLPEERLQGIHAQLRGRTPAVWELYVAIGVLAAVLLGMCAGSVHNFMDVVNLLQQKLIPRQVQCESQTSEPEPEVQIETPPATE